jgi:hypothetical protein
MLISSLDPGFFLHGLLWSIWEGLRIWDLQAENPHESTWMLPSVPLARVKPSKRSGSACRAFKTQRAADCAVAVWMTIKSVSINVLLKKPGWFQLLILQYIYIDLNICSTCWFGKSVLSHPPYSFLQVKDSAILDPEYEATATVGVTNLAVPWWTLMDIVWRGTPCEKRCKIYFATILTYPY